MKTDTTAHTPAAIHDFVHQLPIDQILYLANNTDALAQILITHANALRAMPTATQADYRAANRLQRSQRGQTGESAACSFCGGSTARRQRRGHAAGSADAPPRKHANSTLHAILNP